MRVLFVLLCTLFLAAAAPFRAHAAAPDQPLYVMDMQRVIDNSILGKAAKNSLEAEAKKREAALAAKQADVQRRREQLDKQRSVLAAAAAAEREDELRRADRDLAQAGQDARDELERRRNTEMERIVGEVRKVLSALEERYPLVMERDPRFVLFADDSIDITDEVVAELDRRSVDS